MFKNIETKDGQIIFEFEGQNYSRKIKVIDGVKTFKFKKKRYFYYSNFQLSYGHTSSIQEITEDLEIVKNKYQASWSGLDEFIQDMVEQFNYLETNASSHPSGPDTSKFRATVSGFVREMSSPDTFGQSQYSCGTYIHKAIQLGGNVNKSEIIPYLRYIFPMFAEVLGWNNSDNKIRYEESSGTNFSTYGIG